MKKISLIIITFLVCFTLVACDPSTTINSNNNPSNTQKYTLSTTTKKTTTKEKINLSSSNFGSYFNVALVASNNSMYSMSHDSNSPYNYNVSVTLKNGYEIDTAVNASFNLTFEITYRRSDNSRLTKTVYGTASINLSNSNSSQTEYVTFFPRLSSSENIVSIVASYKVNSVSGKVS